MTEQDSAPAELDPAAPEALRELVSLAPYTTLRLGGPARRLVEAQTAGELVAAISEADRTGEPALVLGGGSNIVVPDAGVSGTVVRVATRGVEFIPAGGRVTLVHVQAGEDWENLVARCVAEGLAGVECLSGVPGSVGATPMQNVGAYGQEVSETIAVVRAYDRWTHEIIELGPGRCEFGYRTSAFKGSDRYVILDVTFALEAGSHGAPIRYQELARTLGAEVGQRVPLEEARAAVLHLRRGKGMVLDPADGDTLSAGSFFTNPVLDADQWRALRERAGTPPGYPAGDGRTKVSAAWLIEQAGFHKGYARGLMRISTKHTLALTNPTGAGTTAELLALAREVRDGVRDTFGVELRCEPTLLGTSL